MREKETVKSESPFGTARILGAVSGGAFGLALVLVFNVVWLVTGHGDADNFGRWVVAAGLELAVAVTVAFLALARMFEVLAEQLTAPVAKKPEATEAAQASKSI